MSGQPTSSPAAKALAAASASWQRHPLVRHLRRPSLGSWSLAVIALVGLAYSGTGWLVLQIPFTSTFATLVWAPSGIALYGILRWGWAGVLGVMLGTIGLNPTLHQTPLFGLVTMIGSVLPGIVASRFLPGAQFDRLFGDTKRITRYLAIAVIGGTLISALIGASAVKLIGTPVPAGWRQVFAIWWAGDAMGVLIVTPALLAIGQLRRLRRPRQLVEFIAIASSFAVVWYLLFAEILGRNVSLPLSYAAIPLVIWVALRFEQAVTVLVALIVILVAVLATARGFGPFVLADGVEASYVFLHGYLAVIAVTALYLSASAAAGRRAMADLQHEIAEQRRIRARLAATNELSGDAIITINQASQIIAFNPAASALFGYDLTEIIGQPYASLLPESERAERQGLLDDFMTSGVRPLQTLHFQELRYRRKDGGDFNTLAAFGRVNIDRTISGIIAIRDMTDIRGKESALRDALREAQLAIRARNEFLANMSHELRTPLNAIIGFAETLKLKLFGDLNERQSEYITDIEASGRHLLTLINGILNYARLERGNWQPAAESVDVSLAIAASCRMLSDKASQRQVALQQRSAARLPNLHCDPVALRQIIINLVDNAIKFSLPGGTIKVMADLNASDDTLVIAVNDDGIGIHESDQRRILEPFTQAAHATTRHHDGLGLGLSIVNHLVEAHQAKLRLESAPGRGTSIQILWPTERLLRELN